MENYELVRPEHLNHYGYLFGGTLLKWVDEFSWIAASLEYPGCNFVTVGMDKVEFKQSVKLGAILRFQSDKTSAGRTSVQYAVTVMGKHPRTGAEEQIFSTNITYVRVDEDGEKMPLP